VRAALCSLSSLGCDTSLQVLLNSGDSGVRGALNAASSSAHAGDHLQLRPKAEFFRLRKEANLGFDVDVSLFERLVSSTMADDGKPFPAVTLQVRTRQYKSR
jgi:hypothetical protein